MEVTAVDVSPVVDSVMPAVVAINSFSTVTRYDFWSGQSTDSEQALGSGSGIIIGQNSGEVLIVTNNHVVSGANRVEIAASVTAVGFYMKLGYAPKNGVLTPDDENLIHLEKHRKV